MSNKTIEQWVKDQYTIDEMEDILNHGCVSGAAHGLIYYHETIKFHDDFEDEIWNMLDEDRQSFGCDSILDLINKFQRANNHINSMSQLKNTLAWYAVEKTCRSIVEENE